MQDNLQVKVYGQSSNKTFSGKVIRVTLRVNLANYDEPWIQDHTVAAGSPYIYNCPRTELDYQHMESVAY